MDIEKLKYEAQNKALHIADVSGSALFNADCMDILPLIPDKSVQLILADLPYVTEWDDVLDLNKLWKEYTRISDTIILFGKQPFTTDLINVGRKWFKYELIWEKDKPTNFALANNQPMCYHENILFFSNNGKKYKGKKEKSNYDTKFKNPKSILYYDTGKKQHLHPTQKPLDLIKWLIYTYSNEGELVLDNTMGVGTTCLGAKELNRKFIGIEKEVKYYELAVARVFGIFETFSDYTITKKNKINVKCRFFSQYKKYIAFLYCIYKIKRYICRIFETQKFKKNERI